MDGRMEFVELDWTVISHIAMHSVVPLEIPISSIGRRSRVTRPCERTNWEGLGIFPTAGN